MMNIKTIIYVLIGTFLLMNSKNSMAQENASNPLAAVNNTDLHYQYFDLGGSNRSDYWVDGAYMITPKLKLKYELHYWNTDITGMNESGMEEFRIKPIYFPLAGAWGDWKYKLAVGAEWVVEFGNEDKGIGTGSDEVAPLVGLALVKGNAVIIPLVQHFIPYNGPNVSYTAFRLIWIQSLAKNFWTKVDFIIPVEWENNAVPATGEVQLGKMFSPKFGAYVEGLAGIGEDRPYDVGVGLGIRFTY